MQEMYWNKANKKLTPIGNAGKQEIPLIPALKRKGS